MACTLKWFKKEVEKTYRDPKRFKNLGALVVSDAETVIQNLAGYMDRGCCDAELRSLGAQVQALPWTFQRTHETKVVRVERFGEIVAAHRNLINAIRQAQVKASSHARCTTTSP
jgi:hypothetical protein